MNNFLMSFIRTLSLAFILLFFTNMAEANVKFSGTRGPGAAKTFKSDGSAGCIDIKISAVGSLPSKNYTFKFLPLSAPIENLFEEVAEVSMNYSSIRSGVFCVKLTEAGQAYIQGLTDPLELDFSILYSGTNDPGFAVLPGTIVFDPASGSTSISFSGSDDIEGNNLTCSPFADDTEVAGNVSLKKDFVVNLEANIELSEAALENASSEASNTRFLSNEEIVVALLNQVSNAVIDVKLSPQARSLATLENTGGYKGRKFQLQDAILSNIQHTGGKITATVKGQVPYVINAKSGMLKKFTNDINVVKDLLSGGSVSADDLDLNTQINLNASYNFVDTAGSIFENNDKKNDFTFSFSNSGASCQ